MSRQSIIGVLVGALLLTWGSAGLMAQKGWGKMGEPGFGQLHPAAAKAGDAHRDGGKTPGAATAHTPHMAGAPNVNASTALANNPNLAALVQPLLPAGETLAAASAGFTSVGEFVSALHVSQNLNISFDALKAKLTGSSPESLGQAIHDLQPTLTRSTVRADVRTAQSEADTDFDTAHIDNQLASNPSLTAAAQALLPSGENLQAAAAGFENMNQFLAAENAAKDLNISFDALKAKLTGSSPETLAEAIHDLAPTLSASAIKTDVQAARSEADAEFDTAHLDNQLSTNTTFASLVQALLPAGANLQASAAGFDNDRQFLLALHLSQDLNISFSQLQAQVAGTNPVSFDQALSTLLPSLSQATIKADIETAGQQASSDLQTAFGKSVGEQGDLAFGGH